MVRHYLECLPEISLFSFGQISIIFAGARQAVMFKLTRRLFTIFAVVNYLVVGCSSAV